jgi:replicative superfamily II helicase
MNTNSNKEINSLFANIIISYDERIQKIQTAFQSSENLTESSQSLFDNVLESLNNLKKRRDLLDSKLCETLSKNGSLRKKDYNSMMSEIISLIDEKESEAEHQFLTFIEAQKETAKLLKKSMLGISDISSQDMDKKIKAIKEQLSQISELQEIRKETVKKAFMNFQRIHHLMIASFESLLKRGNNILINDIKKVKAQLISKIISEQEVANPVN